MTSAITKRRKRRDEQLLKQWAGTPPYTQVTVRRANGATLNTHTLCEPFALHSGAYVRVECIPGNTHLRRVTLGWGDTPPLPSGLSSDAEIRHLRTAMVLAMDDCEAAAAHKGNPVSTRTVLLNTALRLKAALEKK